MSVMILRHFDNFPNQYIFLLLLKIRKNHFQAKTPLDSYLKTSSRFLFAELLPDRASWSLKLGLYRFSSLTSPLLEACITPVTPANGDKHRGTLEDKKFGIVGKSRATLSTLDYKFSSIKPNRV